MEQTPIRERFIKSALDKCRHFTGTQHKACKAGVTYMDEREKTMPCIPRFINGRQTWACDLFEIMSQADAEKAADEWIVMMNRGVKARHAAKDDAQAKGLGKGRGGRGSISCPSCDGGTLRYSVASYNGHMFGKCTTEGCVSWME